MMRYLSQTDRSQLAGEYFAPEGLYDYIKQLPFTGRVRSDKKTLVAGEWTEIALDYEVGGSGLADGAWIKGTFKFYSDWALFQTSDPAKENYVSVEYIPNKLFPGQTPATVQSLSVRFDQKGHERPFQKAVIVDVHDGYLNPGDIIKIRLGDRRFGGKGTRVQTFLEKDFRWRFYIDPVGTSRFAPIRPDVHWNIVAGSVHRIQTASPRLLRPGVSFAIHAHAEDAWGNVISNMPNVSFSLKIMDQVSNVIIAEERSSPEEGWTNVVFDDLKSPADGDYTIEVTLKEKEQSFIMSMQSHLTTESDTSVPRVLFGDLHVHSDDTVGTESSTYNFSYGREVAGLDVLGYTANDFQITKDDWDATINLISSINEPGKFVLFPGTEWCGNSAAGGDHNVVFLADPVANPPEFPFDRHGNVARSFEWSENGPDDLAPGAWPLEDLYCTYAGEAKSHLLIPHVGGRRCNLAWHHPKLERLVEIGSSWGQFEWLLQDAVRRGWKLGVSANSDEHRGRCGGGVPGTAVFGTRGGLTGILAHSLDRNSVAQALRARHTFATTGQRLVGLVTGIDGSNLQGNEIKLKSKESIELGYHFLGEKGFSAIEAFDASGLIWRRHLWSEAKTPATILRVTWGGARLYDRYREAIWNGTISLCGDTAIQTVSPFGGFETNKEDFAQQEPNGRVRFSSKTSGDLDGVNIVFKGGRTPCGIVVAGSLGGYVKVGDALAGNPHSSQPFFKLTTTWDKAKCKDGSYMEIKGGAGLFVRVEAIPAVELPRRLQGKLKVADNGQTRQAVYLVGREWSGEKVVTSPIFIERD